MSEVPNKLSKLDLEIAASNRLYNELLGVLRSWERHPNLSTFMVLGCLEALKQNYYHVRCLDEDQDERR